MAEPAALASIVQVDAPAEMEAGEAFHIPVLINYGAWGDYFIYLIDADTGEILNSDREVAIAGLAWVRPALETTMPPRDLRWRIEVWDEPPPGYPVPIL